MFKIFALFIFYAMIGSIISPETHDPTKKDGKVDGVVHDHSPVHSSTTIKEEHGGGHGQVVSSAPNHPSTPPNPIIDNSVMNWLKQKTNYAEPIEKVQKSSSEFYKILHNYILQEVHKSYSEVEPDHKDDGSKVKESFHKLMQDVKGLKDHATNQSFKNTKHAYSSLKEDPHDEHRQKQMKNALVSDVSNSLSGLFINPLASGEKLLRYAGLIGGDNDAKRKHDEHENKEGHHVDHKDDKSEHQHNQGNGIKDGHNVEHSEHGEKSSLVSQSTHGNSDQKIEPKHSDHNIEHRQGEEVHSKEKHIDHTNPGNHDPPPGSMIEGLVEAFFSYVPIHKVLS